MHKTLHTAMGVAIAAAIALPASADGIALGDSAPALAGIHWIKGEPIHGFEPGKVYVVEMWATWCGPCKKSIPHLTELAEKFKGKVDFIGISVWEKKTGSKDVDYLGRVETFVKAQGDRMVYHVGADGPEERMAAGWLDAFGAPGIPTAFVVDARRRVCWMGLPTDLEPVLHSVLAGTWDIKKALNDQEIAQKAQRQKTGVMKAVEPYFAALKSKDYAAAVKAGDVIFPHYPQFEKEFGYTFYIALSETDPIRADTYAHALAEGSYKGLIPGLSVLVGSMLDAPHPNPESALAIAVQGLAGAEVKKDFWVLAVLGKVYNRSRKPKEALEFDQRALAEVASNATLEEDFPDEVKEVRARIAAKESMHP